MSTLKNEVKKIIDLHYSGLSVEIKCALDLYSHGIREVDFAKEGRIGDLQIPDNQRIPIMNALREIERRA